MPTSGTAPAVEITPACQSLFDMVGARTRRLCPLSPNKTYALSVAEPEIDPFSPAGTVERFGEFSRGLSRRRWGKFAVWAVLALFIVIPAVSYLVVVIVGHH